MSSTNAVVTPAPIKTVPGIQHGPYVVVGENPETFVAIKPEAQMVYFADAVKFWQIGFRVHVRPQEGKDLPPKEAVQEDFSVGELESRDGQSPPRYVTTVRVPVCGATMSAWVIHDYIKANNLIGVLVDALYAKLEASSMLPVIPKDQLLLMATEKFLDMIPDNNPGKALPEAKAYWGYESYDPPEGQPPKAPDYAKSEGKGNAFDEPADSDDDGQSDPHDEGNDSDGD